MIAKKSLAMVLVGLALVAGGLFGLMTYYPENPCFLPCKMRPFVSEVRAELQNAEKAWAAKKFLQPVETPIEKDHALLAITKDRTIVASNHHLGMIAVLTPTPVGDELRWHCQVFPENRADVFLMEISRCDSNTCYRWCKRN